MKLYFWHLLGIGLTVTSWAVIRLGTWLLPKAWDSAPFYLGLLVYLIAFAVLGWGVARVIWLSIQGQLAWGKSLLVVGITLIQGTATLFFFLILLAEGFRKDGG